MWFKKDRHCVIALAFPTAANLQLTRENRSETDMQMSLNEIENILVTDDWLASRDPRAKFKCANSERKKEKRKRSENIFHAKREQITELESERNESRSEYSCACARSDFSLTESSRLFNILHPFMQAKVSDCKLKARSKWNSRKSLPLCSVRSRKLMWSGELLRSGWLFLPPRSSRHLVALRANRRTDKRLSQEKFVLQIIAESAD